MDSVVLTVHLLLAIALIIVVLLQRSEGGGLGMGGGGSVMTGRGAATALSKVTWALGAAFVVTSLALTVLAARTDSAASVLDRLGVEAPAPGTPATAPGVTPDLSEDLLPPAPAPADSAPATTVPAAPPADDGPALPPPVE